MQFLLGYSSRYRRLRRGTAKDTAPAIERVCFHSQCAFVQKPTKWDARDGCQDLTGAFIDEKTPADMTNAEKRQLTLIVSAA
ncbi:hypothetical protein A0H81_11846 [Grifola frondosa]|uniref:Uncharacterized protein n=1 Tax=Grifola frondosa TaxID=5627 RepID=A0A1C7LVI8_GRIFR|nr:hypothetical protein A0H81_11846 [Grifola frondosa]